MSDDSRPVPGGENVKVVFEDGIAWLYLNRPEKRNAMSIELAEDMNRVLDELELDDRCGVVVLTGEGEAFSAGMDLKGFFPRPTRARTWCATALTARTAIGSGAS